MLGGHTTGVCIPFERLYYTIRNLHSHAATSTPTHPHNQASHTHPTHTRTHTAHTHTPEPLLDTAFTLSASPDRDAFPSPAVVVVVAPAAGFRLR